MFRKHQGRRHTNIVFVIFRLILSLVIFAALLGGMYAAYKQFSGLDPLKLDPQAVLNNVLAARTPDEFKAVLSSLKIDTSILGQEIQVPGSKPKEDPQKALNFRFLLLADSHSDNENLQKAINQAKMSFPDIQFIIGLGDYTEVGTVDELKKAKEVLDSSGIRYFLIPGDHDLWDCRNRALAPASCFREVFGPDYQSFTFNDFRFLLLDNSDNYDGFTEEQSNWITNELEKVKEESPKGVLAFLHEPLYHPTSDHVMGWVEKSLKQQAMTLMFQLKDAAVNKVIAGDIHYFSEYLEPRTNLPMMTIGSLGIERNPQTPRFGVASVFVDGEVKVEDIEIK